jgi:hypothetical protein
MEFQEKHDALRQFTHYIWWETPEKALERPERLIAQVMDIGTMRDIFKIEEIFPPKVLISILQNAEAGQFHVRSWHFWHYRLGLAKDVPEVPPMPKRYIPPIEEIPVEIPYLIEQNKEK